jgi:hypothetical protein
VSADHPIEMFRSALASSGLRLDSTSTHVGDASDTGVADWALRRKILAVAAEAASERAFMMPTFEFRSMTFSHVLAGR